MTIYLAHPTARGSLGSRFRRDGVATEVKRPTRGRAGRPQPPYLALLQVGFGRRCVTVDDRTLLPSDFTLILPSLEGRYVSVPLSVPRGSPDASGASAEAWALPSTLPGGARTFLPDGPDESELSRRSPGLPGSPSQSSTEAMEGQYWRVRGPAIDWPTRWVLDSPNLLWGTLRRYPVRQSSDINYIRLPGRRPCLGEYGNPI